MITEKVPKTQRNYPISMIFRYFIRIQNQIVLQLLNMKTERQ